MPRMARVVLPDFPHHNRFEGRSGTLWEGRYKSSLVSREDYLLSCCRYIELNPVRARMVADPQDYPWSSCRARFGAAPADLLDAERGQLTGSERFREQVAAILGRPVERRGQGRPRTQEGAAKKMEK